MLPRLKILVVSRSGVAAEAVAARVSGAGRFIVSTRVVTNGHADPLGGLQTRPDLLILHYVPGYGELDHLAGLDPAQRLPLLVFGPAADANAMRLAMRAGASDYLPEPLCEADLLHALERIGGELSRKAATGGKLITLVNSKGGSGSSFLAANLACALAQDHSGRTALLDLDLPFGGITRYLDVAAERGIIEALDAIGDMDEVAASAFAATHKSGLKIVTAPATGPVQHVRVAPERINLLLQVFLQGHETVVADLPRRMDVFGDIVLERSDCILLVVQQTLGHINCAAKLLHLVCNEHGIPRDRVRILVNRFTRNSVVELDDIRKTLRIDEVHAVPNQYKLVAESIDTGKPVTESAKGSAVAKALFELAAAVSGTDGEVTRRGGFLSRALPNLLGTH